MNTTNEQLLAGDVWAKIAQAWNELAACPVNEPDAALLRLLGQVEDLTDSQRSYCMIAVREPGIAPGTDNLFGWRPLHIIRSPTFGDPAFSEYWTQQPENFVNSQAARQLVRRSGRHRTYLRHDLIGATPWADSHMSELLRFYRVHDRATACYSLAEHIELHFVMDRTDDNPVDYGEYERAILMALLQGLGPICLRLAMSFGLLESHLRLTARERETLLHLLDSKSEKEIGVAMNLTHGSAHQNVVSVFRKLQVSSRAELMALWMSPPLQSTQSLHEISEPRNVAG